MDDKFKSPEELAKAYNELQSKLGENTPTNESATNEENPSEAETDNELSPQMDKAIGKANSEYDERGELSDKTFIALEKAGIPRDMVETYIRGQEAIALGQASEVQDTVGGNANYNAMTEWAG